MRVLTAIRKDILEEVIINNRTDLVSHSYYLFVDIRERHPLSKKFSRKTRIVNFYDDKIGERYVWQGTRLAIRWVVQDICWKLVIRGRVLIVGDMNAYSII